jgi:hypothetical protein
LSTSEPRCAEDVANAALARLGEALADFDAVVRGRGDASPGDLVADARASPAAAERASCSGASPASLARLEATGRST